MFNSKKVYICSGEVAEWSNAPVLKTGIPQGIWGSNPYLSAKNEISEMRSRFFVYTIYTTQKKSS